MGMPGPCEHGSEAGSRGVRSHDVARSEAENSASSEKMTNVPYFKKSLVKKDWVAMRKRYRQQAEDFIRLLGQAHTEIRKALEAKKFDTARGLLEQCQEGVIELGHMIEESEGEEAATVPLLEEYCELVYQIHESIWKHEYMNANKIYKNLRKAQEAIGSSIKNDIKEHIEVVFLPYKASMWDSLESIWMAADADPDCDAYVVPVPYYERGQDGSLSMYHYEGGEFPDYVPVTHYENYNIKSRQPDMIYIHNPYDQGNYVTTIDPRYYSAELKKHTPCLVYVPYYATSGGMSEGQSLCPAYFHADYIIIQSEKFRRFFDPAVPGEKLLPLGSPKFDRVVRICSRKKELPDLWKEKLEGKKAYFYNTSINGMLEDTAGFLEKMEYVFRCFWGRDDVCLVWRPHPLLESTFDSMRKELRPVYDRLKQYFTESGLGIYDDTPDITETVAICDGYIGDSATSVTSLFGLAGKPLFILNNKIHSSPEPDDWRGQVIKGFSVDRQDKWMVTQGNKLYYAPEGDYRYEYWCDLSEYSGGTYYSRAIEIDGDAYVCPANGQDILVIGGEDAQSFANAGNGHKMKGRIKLERHVEQPGAFADAWNIGRYLFLVPFHYPAIVKYDTALDKVDTITGYKEGFVQMVQGEWRIGGSCVWEHYLMLASPIDNHVIAIDSNTNQVQVMVTGAKNTGGCMALVPEGRQLWLLPYTGTTITCWNPETGEVREYPVGHEGFLCRHRLSGRGCLERPFSRAAFCGDKVFLSPYWGNQFLCLDRETGEAEEWKPPFEVPMEARNGYYNSWAVGSFLYRTDTLGLLTYRFFCYSNGKLYDVNLDTQEFREIPVEFDMEELKRQEPGFLEESEWLQYGCLENCFNSLERFLDGATMGNGFDRDRQLQAYRKIAANNDGTSGEKIYQFAKARLQGKAK